MGTLMGDKDSFLAGLLCGFLWGCEGSRVLSSDSLSFRVWREEGHLDRSSPAFRLTAFPGSAPSQLLAAERIFMPKGHIFCCPSPPSVPFLPPAGAMTKLNRGCLGKPILQQKGREKTAYVCLCPPEDDTGPGNTHLGKDQLSASYPNLTSRLFFHREGG